MLGVLLPATVAGATVVFSDDFESYADNNALTAAYDTNDISGLHVMSGTCCARDNQSVFNPNEDVGGFLSNSFPAIRSTTDTIVVTYWLYDSSGTGPGSTGSDTLNGRAGLMFGAYSGGAWGSGSLEGYVFMGPYHQLTPEFYVTRAYPGVGWQATSVTRTVGWQKFTMRLHQGVVRFYHDDVLVMTDNYTEPTSGWNCFKLGSTTTIAGNRMNAYYDDIEIRVEPESASTYKEGKVIYFGFPFETIYPESARNIVMEKVIECFFPSVVAGWEVY